MLDSRGPHEITLTNSAVLLHLLRRLIDANLLQRKQALAMLGDAADELEATPSQTSGVHMLAADIIRKELVPKVETASAGVPLKADLLRSTPVGYARQRSCRRYPQP